MTWNHFQYFFLPLGMGLLFAGVGLFLLRRRREIGCGRLRAIFGSLLAVVFLGVGLWLAASLLLGPWPGKRSRLINEVLQARAEDVVAIEVAPHPNETCASLVGVPRTIADRADISRLCQALREARSCSLNHPRSLWSAVLTLRKRTGAFACVVANTDQGVLLRFLSNADRGWMFGVFASADLGGILKAIVKAGDKDQ